VCHRLRSDLPHAALEAYASAVVIDQIAVLKYD
jgi:hypothetical protein